ncbi:hypothetical protein C1645_825976 [Glomus cerebriforme]|uniref:Uncharacterized protein n=1 Tax=Glomus cerebriforme TaxID=658196 RepID=A0A397SUT0_9GLOM|nr:hypothetical protein C1645_825976 [Glomus cerebriforme]
MTYTSDTTSPNDLNMNELQDRMIQSIKHFSEIQKIKVKDNKFIQEKVGQISNQRVEFRKFAEDSIIHSLKMRTHADDLIIFAECCEDDDISSEDLLELLRTLLSDSKLYKNRAKLLKNVLERVKISLDGIGIKITEYDEKITNKRKDLPDKIDRVDKVTDGALSYAKAGLVVAGIGAIAAVPLTAGISLAVASGTSLATAVGTTLTAASIEEVAIFGFGALSVVGGTATTSVSTAVAGGSFVASGILNYELKGVREQFSQFLREMRAGLKNVNEIITHCESHWETQIVEIEDIIKKLEHNDKNGRRLVKTLARTISAKAKKIRIDSESYSVNMRQALNKDSISQTYRDYRPVTVIVDFIHSEVH